MAIKFYKESDCVSCEICYNCGRRDGYIVAELYCDKCGNEVDELYDVDDELLCEDCLTEHFPKITYDKAIEDWREKHNE